MSKIYIHFYYHQAFRAIRITKSLPLEEQVEHSYAHIEASEDRDYMADHKKPEQRSLFTWSIKHKQSFISICPRPAEERARIPMKVRRHLQPCRRNFCAAFVSEDRLRSTTHPREVAEEAESASFMTCIEYFYRFRTFPIFFLFLRNASVYASDTCATPKARRKVR